MNSKENIPDERFKLVERLKTIRSYLEETPAMSHYDEGRREKQEAIELQKRILDDDRELPGRIENLEDKKFIIVNSKNFEPSGNLLEIIAKKVFNVKYETEDAVIFNLECEDEESKKEDAKKNIFEKISGIKKDEKGSQVIILIDKFDLHWCPCPGYDIVKYLREKGYGGKIFGFSRSKDPKETEKKFLKAGADGYIENGDDPILVLLNISEAVRGDKS